MLDKAIKCFSLDAAEIERLLTSLKRNVLAGQHSGIPLVGMVIAEIGEPEVHQGMVAFRTDASKFVQRKLAIGISGIDDLLVKRKMTVISNGKLRGVGGFLTLEAKSSVLFLYTNGGQQAEGILYYHDGTNVLKVSLVLCRSAHPSPQNQTTVPKIASVSTPGHSPEKKARRLRVVEGDSEPKQGPEETAKATDFGPMLHPSDTSSALKRLIAKPSPVDARNEACLPSEILPVECVLGSRTVVPPIDPFTASVLVGEVDPNNRTERYPFPTVLVEGLIHLATIGADDRPTTRAEEQTYAGVDVAALVNTVHLLTALVAAIPTTPGRPNAPVPSPKRAPAAPPTTKKRIIWKESSNIEDSPPSTGAPPSMPPPPPSKSPESWKGGSEKLGRGRVIPIAIINPAGYGSLQAYEEMLAERINTLMVTSKRDVHEWAVGVAQQILLKKAADAFAGPMSYDYAQHVRTLTHLASEVGRVVIALFARSSGVLERMQMFKELVASLGAALPEISTIEQAQDYAAALRNVLEKLK